MLTPTYYFGQGFGELPDTIGWARPLAVTGQVGYQIPTTSFDVGQGTFIPQVLVYGASLPPKPKSDPPKREKPVPLLSSSESSVVSDPALAESVSSQLKYALLERADEARLLIS